jgi:hypothetical protein
MGSLNVGNQATPCTLTSTQVLVEDNNQLATLDVATGKQLSYTDDKYTDSAGNPSCPIMLESGLSGVAGAPRKSTRRQPPVCGNRAGRRGSRCCGGIPTVAGQ